MRDKKEATRVVNSIRLVTRCELVSMFPEATIKDERFRGLTVSFIVYGGWGIPELP